MNIAGREIGPGYPCFIVAEISCNHMGSLRHAMALIEAAKNAGADAVKFQAFTVEENIANRGDGPAPPPWDHMSKRELYGRCHTPFEWFPVLFDYARRCGIIAFSSVSGPDSLAMLEKLDCPAYKIAKPEHMNNALINAACETGKPVLVSQPDYSFPMGGRDTFRLYCPPGYPTPVEDIDLWPDIAGMGLSSHCLVPELPVAAVALGAYVLEYHLMLPDTEPLDASFSHTPESFKAMVQSVRRTEEIMGAS